MKKDKKDKERSAKHYAKKIKDRAKHTPLKTGSGLRCSGRINSSCSASHVPTVM